MSNHIKNITATIIFEGAALNRDEKIGGNILSIKKLNVNGEVRSYLSKVAIRHYLFETLQKANPDLWKPAKVTTQGKVVQFDLTSEDILSSSELDAFGYMYTIQGGMSLTRKSPLGITKAISLNAYNQDLSFYANHDLVTRAIKNNLKASPNPYSKEENQTLYKLSLTIDAKIFGREILYVKSKPLFDEKNMTLTIELEKPKEIILKNVEKFEDEEEGFYYKIKDYIIQVDGLQISISEDLVKKQTDKNSQEEVLTFQSKFVKSKSDLENEGDETTKKGKTNFKITSFDYDEEEKKYIFSLNREPLYNESEKTLKLELGAVRVFNILSFEDNSFTTVNGTITFREFKKDFFEVQLEIEPKLKKQRIRSILEAIKDGLYAQSSGEVNTIIPLFIMASGVKVPSPVFHPFIDLRKEENEFQLIGINDCLENSWVNGNKIFLKDTDRLKVKIESEKITRDWNEFLNDLGLGDDN